MASDDEIECLDEDADIVQQCVKTINTLANSFVKEQPLLLVERPLEKKRKRKKVEVDSDYDPKKDVMVHIPDYASNKRRTKRTARKSTRNRMASSVKPVKKPAQVNTNTSVQSARTLNKQSSVNQILSRRKMNICIPDYEDPLCMPVRAISVSAYNIQRLKNWNNACLEHFKQCDNVLKPEKGTTQSSSRTVVLRKVVHKQTGNTETAVWHKTCVANKEGLKKSEIFQCLLPKFREKNVLNPFVVQSVKRYKVFHSNEVILTKEKHKDGETLVVYNPNDSVSAVYQMRSTQKSVGTEAADEEDKKVMKEIACCKVCAPCYQLSWRGKGSNKDIWCPICKRTMVSVYNLLTHLKGHTKAQIVNNKRAISATIAGVLDYHYTCRVCQKKFPSIKDQKSHILTHKGSVQFKCEVGNHLTS